VAYERKDGFYRRAKREGYRSRAAFKLAEIHKRTRVLGRAERILDLGAWPGGWLQVAAEHVGARGRVVGVDLAAIDPLADPRIQVLRGDVADPALPARVQALLGGPADVVLSDLAPKLTGIAPRDEARAAELSEHTLRIAATCSRPGSALVVKTFGGAEAEDTRAALATRYTAVRLIHLAATRKGSSELYLVATGFRGDRGTAAPGGLAREPGTE
jgi:23S rRNA (uridine2552-2'-O)-methyltransferase